MVARPVGSRPQISPTSFPTFAGLLTPAPASSNAGCRRISGITILPTKPVPQTTTRLAISLLALVVSCVEDPFQSVELGNEGPIRPVFHS